MSKLPPYRWFIAGILSAVLIACGGGGGGNDAPTTSQPPITTLPPVEGMIVLPDSEIYWRARPDYVPKNLHVDFYGDSILLGVGVKKSPIERIAAVRPHWIIDHH